MESHPPASLEECLERRKADRVLSLLDIHEPLAERAETAPDGLLRQAFANRYRDIFGIDPSERTRLRTALKVEGTPVIDVLEQFGGLTQDLNGIV